MSEEEWDKVRFTSPPLTSYQFSIDRDDVAARMGICMHLKLTVGSAGPQTSKCPKPFSPKRARRLRRMPTEDI